jgi:beta-hydroxylase
MTLDSLLDGLLSWRFILLAVFVSMALYAHFRGRTHQRFLREVFGPATLLAPINVPIYLSSAVPSTPFLDIDLIPGLRFLEQHWKELREEVERLYSQGGIRASDSYDDAGFNSFFRHGWKRFYLMWYGEPTPSAKELCPRTLELLAQVPAVKAAMFVRMAPKSRLPVHRDPFAGSLRFHLGLRTPNSEKCRITVDGQTYWWKDGEGVLFDETFLHRAENETDEDRLILFCDVERPLRTRAARAFNHFIGDTLMRAFRTKNVQGEEVGALSKAFAALYPIRVLGKRIKQYNRPLYFTLKYLLVAVVLYSIFFWR